MQTLKANNKISYVVYENPFNFLLKFSADAVDFYWIPKQSI